MSSPRDGAVTRWLDHAATSHPKPPEVVEAVRAAVEGLPANPGRGATSAARSATRLLEDAREAVAAFLGLGQAHRLAFTLNATDSLNIAIKSLVRPGATVVTSAVEHASVLRPLHRLERDAGVRLLRVAPRPGGWLDPDEIAERAREADCAVLTCASNVTGAVSPWEEIARRLPERCPLVLDAAQAAGSLALSVDALGPRTAVAVTGHKALLGPMGVGALAVGEGLLLGPWREGGTGDSENPFQPEAYPKRLEAGTQALPAIAGLAAGVRWLGSRGPEAVRAHEAGLADRMLRGLRAIPGALLPGPAAAGDTPARRAPLVGFLVDDWRPEEVAQVLDAEFGVSVRAGLHCAPEAHRWLGTFPAGTVRASVGPTSTDADVEELLHAVAAIAGA